MFSGEKIIKSKPFTAPSHKDGKVSNSRDGFAVDLRQSEICNRSFDTAQSLLTKSTKNLKQTKICLSTKINSENTSKNYLTFADKSHRNTASMEFCLMPLPNEKPTTSKRSLQEANNEINPKNFKDDKTVANDEIASRPNPINTNGRKKFVMIGKVDFCLKMHKLYPNLDILWDVYGKVVRILPGKAQCEHILLLRTTSNEGPVVQSIYFDFNNVLSSIQKGTCLRAVGKFMNENRLRTFKLEKINCEKYEKDFSRIQSVISFALSQNNAETK